MLDNSKKIRIRRQCTILGLNRSTLYYKPRPTRERTKIMMQLLDEQYTKTPFYGVPRMTKHLKDKGFKVGKLYN